MRHRICIVGLTAAPILLRRWLQNVAGGAEMQQVLLARELARRGHEVSFIVQHPDLPAEQSIDGLHVYCMRPARLITGLNAAVKSRRLYRLLMRIEPTVIYQRMAEWSTGVCAAAARRFGAVFIHALASDRDVSSTRSIDGNLWQLYMHRWGLRRAAKVLVQHAGQAEDLRRNFSLEGHIFPSVYHAAPPQSAAQRNGIYWIAALRPKKRPQLLLELARRLPELPFVMIGGPGSKPEGKALYERIAAEAERLPNVSFLGFHPPDEIDDRLAGAALLVNTSEYEGLPVTFLQAWRQSVPTIGFEACGRDGILDHCGWRVDSLNQMADLIRTLTADPNQTHQRGHQAREYFTQHHALDVIVPRFEALIDKTVAAESIRRGPRVSRDTCITQ